MYMNGLKSAATYNGIEKLLVYVIRKSNDVYGVKYPLWTSPKKPWKCPFPCPAHTCASRYLIHQR